MRYTKPRPPTITFASLIRRRGYTLDTWLSATGVSSYPEVVRWCDKIGCIPPSEDEYRSLRPVPVNAPLDGIVVVNPVAPEAPSPVGEDSIPAEPANIPEGPEEPTSVPKAKRGPKKKEAGAE